MPGVDVRESGLDKCWHVLQSRRKTLKLSKESWDGWGRHGDNGAKYGRPAENLRDFNGRHD